MYVVLFFSFVFFDTIIILSISTDGGEGDTRNLNLENREHPLSNSFGGH